jgi:hypothetical protein
MNSTYKDTANFADEEDHLRMIYVPADFSDLHLRDPDQATLSQSDETVPVIQGIVEGINSSNVLTVEFTITMEYVPKPLLYQVVERKPAKVDSKK